MPSSTSTPESIPTRAQTPVTLPVPNPTTSSWQSPPSHLSSHRSTPALPAIADTVIIGSGISGAMVAWNLLSETADAAATSTLEEEEEEEGEEEEGADNRPQKQIVLLEARAACSGATGRNAGGHTKAASYRSFASHASHHGARIAAQIARLELSNIRATHAFARARGLDCEAASRRTVDVVYSREAFEAGKAAIGLMREVLGTEDPAAEYIVYEGEEARERFFVKGGAVEGGERCVGAFEYEAGSVNAYGFVTGVLDMCVRRGLNLQTWTPVVGLEGVEGEDGDGDDARWVVRTERGCVRARDVVLATNGYTARLLPELQARVVPLRGQITAQRPGNKLPVLPTTYSFIYDEGYEYMISRPANSPFPNDIVIGGGLGKLPNAGACEYGETDDGSLNEEVRRYLGKTTKSYFGECWGEDEGEMVRQEWTGVMGATVDGLPFVGPFPEKPGLWVSAGFNGHGMVLCLKCAEALTHVLLGGSKKDIDWFPDPFWVSVDRIKHGDFEGRRDLKPAANAENLVSAKLHKI
ncbi:FAD dependent oxidoreductase [Saccharata proteae CBS 121410]|uniref:FAD dependent oxidoreductase n=1 Tax=Saccharata proteae CBS 121410 TaxID=1314787 RepID=A0A9P4HPZ6_9PEZI|nr:FAD dependent oxidoreductase [Saccharata proteae CBS 121410]